MFSGSCLCGCINYRISCFEGPFILRIRLGTLDTPLEGVIKPQAHIFVASKADWDNICDDLPQFAQFPSKN